MKVYNAGEFARTKIEIPWIVDRLVPAYGISVIYAEPKIGKSIMSLQLAHCVSTGKPFLDRPVTRRKVCYVQADEPPQEWAHQLSEISDKAGYEIGEGWDTIAALPGCLMDPAMFEQLKKLLAPYDFVILDALVSLFGYPDITSPQSAGLLLEKIRKLHPGPVWLIHHKRKPPPGVPDQSRASGAGSFVINAGVSAIFDLTKSRMTGVGRVVKEELSLRSLSRDRIKQVL